MPVNLDTELLRAFVAVADSRSFTRAGAELLRTQAAVSQQVKRLEEVVGARVFERDPRGVRLTPEGERLLAYARRLLALNDEALAAFGHRRRTAGRPVRVGAPDDYATLLLPPLLGALAAAHPEVAVEVVCDDSADLAPAVERGAYDLALVTRRPGAAGGTPLRREPLVWVAPPAAAVERAEPLPLALFPPGCVCRAMTTAALERAGRPWRVAFASDSVLAIHGAVLGGLAVTALEACTVPPGLRVVGAGDGLPGLPEVEIALLRGPAPATAAVRCLEDAIAAALGAPAR
ncbi:LysR substrate-binding domain-containing protein [Azospirillum sp. ST 5-10]|uniref:LysR substrate-binding domain-containing protein n=1 Tax=unclassified Azospirillum TaxID=2630922 RepID=UPI003F4A50E8